MSNKRYSNDKDLAFLFILEVVFYVIFNSLTGLDTLITRIMVAGIAFISSFACWLFFIKKRVKKISDIRITIFSSIDEDEKTSSYYSIAILLSLTFYLIFPDMRVRNILLLLIILLFWGYFRKTKSGDDTYIEDAYARSSAQEFLKNRANNEHQNYYPEKKKSKTRRRMVR